MPVEDSDRVDTSVNIPVLSWSVNDPVVPSVVQAADRKQFWVQEDGSGGEQPGGVDRQQREGVA